MSNFDNFQLSLYTFLKLDRQFTTSNQLCVQLSLHREQAALTTT